jgi:hypothetical protein
MRSRLVMMGLGAVDAESATEALWRVEQRLWRGQRPVLEGTCGPLPRGGSRLPLSKAGCERVPTRR